MQVLGNYRIEHKIAEGGMGEVYYGRHIKLDREVAIKKLHTHLTNNPDFESRFINEANVLAKLSHPNIVTIYDLIEDEESFYIVMEYINGATFDEVIKNGTLTRNTEYALKIFKKILLAFDFAHERGVIHRDIKPANIVLNPEGDPVILDFGIAKLMTSNSTLTRTGTKLGSIFYMSPEQVLGQEITNRSDIYSLGIFLYEFLTGRLPYNYNTESDYEIMEKIVREDINVSSLNGKSDNLKYVILKATNKFPDQRFWTCKDFFDAIDTMNVRNSHQITFNTQTKHSNPYYEQSNITGFNAEQSKSKILKENNEPSIKVAYSVASVLFVAGFFSIIMCWYISVIIGNLLSFTIIVLCIGALREINSGKLNRRAKTVILTAILLAIFTSLSTLYYWSVISKGVKL